MWDRALELGEKHGYRNAQVTVLAPTGTIGFLMDCDTTGIEPDIALVKYKLLAGGGMLKIVNQTVKPALEKLGYNSEEIEQISAHVDKCDTIEDVEVPESGTVIPSGIKPEHLPVFDCAFKPAKGRRSLHYMAHLRMMAAAQPFLSGAISKTVNMPETATVDEIMNTYVEGWRLGLKAIAIYRDGSKRSAPLNVKKTKHMGTTELDAEISEKQDLESRIVELESEIDSLRVRVNQPVRTRMPDTRVALNHKFEIAGHEGYITVGLYEDGQPGRALHPDGEGRQHHRRPHGHRRHAHLDGAAIRRAARKPGEEICLSAFRAERVHQESRHPERDQHHRLRVPLARLPVHPGLQGSDLAEPRPKRAADEGTCRH